MSEKEKTVPLERYFRILETLSAFPAGLTLTEVASVVDLPKASAHRLLRTMQQVGLVAPMTDGGMAYAPGERLRRLAYTGLDMSWIETITRPLLRSLTEETGETTFIAKISGTTVRSIVLVAPDAPWRGFVLPGREMPLHAASSAKAILAFQSPDTVRRALSKPLTSMTAETMVDMTAIQAEHELIRRRGYATCMGEIDEGLAGIAVPIDLDGIKGVYSLGLTGPLNRVIAKDPDCIARMLQTYAGRIGKALLIGAERNQTGHLGGQG